MPQWFEDESLWVDLNPFSLLIDRSAVVDDWTRVENQGS
jgi:hypothetical protein